MSTETLVAEPVNPSEPTVNAEEWTAPPDGELKVWNFKGRDYLRDAKDNLWANTPANGFCEWAGVFLPAENRIDDSAPEPEYEEKEGDDEEYDGDDEE